MNHLLTDPFVRHLVWRSLLLPGVAALVAGLILMAFARGARHRNMGGLWALPLLAGLLTGYFGVYRDWSPWPHTVLGWLPALAVATVLLAGWAARRGRRLGWLAAGLLTIAASGVLLHPVLRQATAFGALREWAAVAILWWLLWTGSAGGREGQQSVGASQIVLAAGLAAAGPLSQSILIGQLAMVLGASWAVVLALSWVRNAPPLSAPAAELGVLVLGILYIELWYYAAAPWRVVLALLVAAALGAVADLLYQRRATSGSGAGRLAGLVIPAAVTAVPAAVGVYFAWLAYAGSGGGY